MGHLTHEQSKKVANKVILILAIITIFEVFLALLGKGHLVDGVTLPAVLLSGAMIIMSVVKAYLIIYEFMHMKYEMPGLVKSVLLPTVLLIWAVIAFSWEGSDWKKRRSLINEKDKEEIDVKSIGLVKQNSTYQIG